MENFWTDVKIIFHHSHNTEKISISRSHRSLSVKSLRSNLLLRFCSNFYFALLSYIFILKRRNVALSKFLLCLFKWEAQKMYSKKPFYILLIQSMEKFSLSRTIVGDCYRVLFDGRWMWKKSNKKNLSRFRNIKERNKKKN